LAARLKRAVITKKKCKVVEAPGIETSAVSINAEKSGTSGEGDSAAAGGSNEAKCATTGGLNDSANESPDAVLMVALDRASAAGQWDIVRQLGEELQARRLARAGNVVSIDARRSKV
jgi:hypothetical protein